MVFRTLTKRRNSAQSTIDRLQVGSHCVIFVRKTIQSVRLSINHKGEIRLAAPTAFSKREALAFLTQRLPWIDEQATKILQQQQLEPADFSCIYLFGVSHQTQIHFHPIAPRVYLDDAGVVHFFLKRESQTIMLGKILEAWYCVELRKYVEQLSPVWEEKMGVKAQAYRFRNMTSRWGSCHVVKHMITLNSQLAKQAPSCIEYILVHELAHLLERGHGKAFKTVMDTYLSDWRQRRQLLNKGLLSSK
jgi:predicted metal-dependent hydrolase